MQIATTEDPRTQARRRLQQRRCLVCGSRRLVNHNQSYFCGTHITTHRYCSTCETLRTVAEHGRDSRCKACATTRATAAYYADPDRTLYRLRLKAIARRTESRSDQVFAAVRRRIAIAALVKATPHLSWRQRAALVSRDAKQLAADYRRQCAGGL